MGDAGSAGIVGLDGRGGLWVAHFNEGRAERYAVARIVVEATKLGFSGGRHNIFENVADSVDGAVVGGKRSWGFGWIWRKMAEEEVATDSAAGFGLRQIGGITADPEYHVAGTVADGGIKVGGTVVQKFCEGFGGFFGAFRLGSSKGAKSNEHGGVDSTCIVEEGADDLLDALETSRSKGGGGVMEWEELDSGTVVGSNPVVGRMFGAGWHGMLETVEGGGQVVRHGDVTCSICVIPCQV